MDSGPDEVIVNSNKQIQVKLFQVAVAIVNLYEN